MRRYILLVVFLFLSIPLLAQLEVKEGSFKELPGFVNDNPEPDYQSDDNNNPFAVIKVKTENFNDKQRRALKFESNLAVGIMVEFKSGEIWVYLTAKYADYLKISHPDFGSTEFPIPFALQPNKGYEMTLVNKTDPAQIEVIYNSVLIRTDQANAEIYIDGTLAGKKEVVKTYKAGETHEWRIECDLFKTETGELTIPNKEGEPIIIAKQLQPEYGYIYVTSTPEDGAVVYIDGKMCGQTPYKSNKLSIGEHEVKVVKDVCFSSEKTFVVTDKNTTQAAMTMKDNCVNITATTDSESDIYVDNEKKGVGQWRGRLNDGLHKFEARKASHKTSVKNVQLVLGNDETIIIPNPTPIYGMLDITSNPTGADIIIDGKKYGTTPKVITDVIIGNHELCLKKTGCGSVTKFFTLVENNKLTINEDLPTDKKITISTEGTGDKIFVDGNFVGNSPLTATLSFGEHNVKAVRDGKETSKKITVAQTGGESSVKLTFATGAGNGVFSVSSNKKVQFSKGNLQYQASTRTWRFAEHQWDIIGDANKNISFSYSGWIDLFGWGTSGYNGQTPYTISRYSNDYGNGDRDIAGTNYDWGVNNTISNGGGKQWRTLTKNEWAYVFDERSTNSGIRYAKATVNGVNGVILLPDNWSGSNHILINANKSDASYSSNSISQSDWTSKLEVNGAVFLPAAGYRLEKDVYKAGSLGYYWSSTFCFYNFSAYSVSIGNSGLGSDNNSHDPKYGHSVRLVCPAE